MAATVEILRDRPPELEVYGRSLSTVYTLGALAVEKSFNKALGSPEAAQARIEFYTSVEEGFGTDMELGGGLEVRDFDVRPVAEGRVMAKDGKRAITDMTKAGLICAEETALADLRFAPQLIRSKWDHKNALEVDAMAGGKTDYNTRIVVSPFPEEAAAQSGNAYWRGIGYVPHLRRGFVQLYHATEKGPVLTGSLSFDGSNKKRLREVFGQLDVAIPDDEITDNWLKYAINGTFTEEQAIRLATGIADKAGDPRYKKNTNTVDITKQYEQLVERAFSESYIHVCESLYRGYQTTELRKLVHQFANNAQHFNERYARALYSMRANSDYFTDDDSIILHELLVYSTIEMMRALHLEDTTVMYAHAGSSYVDLHYIDASSFQSLLGGFGADGARNNRGYSACGLEIALGGNPEERWNEYGPQAAYGGIDKKSKSEDDDCDFISKSCPMCGQKNVKTVVRKLPGGKKHISGGCGCSKVV
ncbi:MAG TPA: hypothetical protein VLG92_01075 [Candidatus Saccharimonadia bacterium]|nr:hypothetical protein [Candidatus Saccharimonadia bacterium]